ncbi:MAG: ATP-dependent DNA helicase [Magnetococcales bacterium]|nr:ATP-dependent DNA helicase [Magnetococcales bacterium]NGZ06232.1 ATP-dependent DNA helicase [Magnetococcales bacterium]
MDVDALVEGLFGAGSRMAATLPGYEARTVQTLMARQVVETALAGGTVLIEAPTGTGKTLAYLVPLLSLEHKVIVSTATKALQDQIMEKDLGLVRQALGRPFTAAALKGRANYLCLYRYRAFRHEGLPVLEREREWAFRLEAWVERTETGERDEFRDMPEGLVLWSGIHAGGDHCLGRKCSDFSHCFLNRARERARSVDLVVVNHHLFFADLAVKEGGFGEILPEYDALVFDEAHRIPDVVTRFFAMEISNYKLRDLARDTRREFEDAGGGDEALLGALAGVEEAAFRLRNAFPLEDQRVALTPEDLQGEAGHAMHAVEWALHALREELEPHRIRSPGLAACGRRADEMQDESARIRALNDPARVYWYETRNRGIFLSAAPLETGPILKESLHPRVKTAIFASATLTAHSGPHGFAYFQEQMGYAAQDVQVCRLPPVFDYATRSLLYLPRHLPEPLDPGFAPAVVAELVALLTLSSGRALCLFTSFRMLELTRDGLVGRIPYRVLVQGEASKGALLEAFKRETSSVLLGVSSFWEGVDAPGETLSMVVVDRLPFASPGEPLVAARQRWLERNGRNAFRELSLPQAILTLKQGLGRLLRKHADRGVMVVLDSRLTQKWYGRFFLEGLPNAPVTHDREAVRRFFA